MDCQGTALGRMHLALGGAGGALESFRVADYAAYYRWAKRRFGQATQTGGQVTYPEPVAHCDVCDWKPTCRAQWQGDDHLSLVAGITRKQRRHLEERGVATLAALGRLQLPMVPPLDAVGSEALAKVREQARIQLAGREAEAALYELLHETRNGFGLCALPAPAPGDLFLDFEGDPYALEDGIEYLLGYADDTGTFVGLWAVERAYETTAIERLAALHATRVAEVDDLLSKRVFVDLHRVVRQGLRASVESYSIKQLEPLYRFTRCAA